MKWHMLSIFSPMPFTFLLHRIRFSTFNRVAIFVSKLLVIKNFYSRYLQPCRTVKFHFSFLLYEIEMDVKWGTHDKLLSPLCVFFFLLFITLRREHQKKFIFSFFSCRLLLSLCSGISVSLILPFCQSSSV